MGKEKEIELLDCQVRIILENGKVKEATVIPLFESREKVVFTVRGSKDGEVLIGMKPKVLKVKKGK